jgi:hypothetical protein
MRFFILVVLGALFGAAVVGGAWVNAHDRTEFWGEP